MSAGYSTVSTHEVNTEIVENMRKANQLVNTDAGAEKNYRWKKFVRQLGYVIDSRAVITIMTLLTIYSLFSDDFRIAFTNSADADKTFEVISSLTFFAFAIEVTSHAIVHFQDYFLWPTTFSRKPDEDFFQSILRRIQVGSFYFWLDIISTFTLIAEMPWLVGTGSASSGTAKKIGAAARVAARAGRIVRLLRMMRYIKLDSYIQKIIDVRLLCWTRLSSFGKACIDTPQPKKTTKKSSSDKYNGEGSGSPRRQQKLQDDGGSGKENNSVEMIPMNTTGMNGAPDGGASQSEVSHANADEASEETIVSESLVGKIMADLTNKRVIMMVVTMLICIPLLSLDSTDNSEVLMTNLIAKAASTVVAVSPASRTAAMISGIISVIQLQNTPFLDPNIRVQKIKDPVISVTFSPPIDYMSGSTKMSFSGWSDPAFVNTYIRTSDILEITTTQDALTVVIKYYDRHLQVTQRTMSMNTTLFVIGLLVLGSYFFAREIDRLVIGPIETMVSLVAQISRNPLGVDYNKAYGERDGFFPGMETTVLLNTINKIGGLMRVGFGEAGASVIADNLKNSAGGRLNLMTGGRMINSIFGFCDVRQFTDTTECLQEEVMLFVNRIGHILHTIVNQCSGSANKNIGDAFLLTWKLQEDYSSAQISLLADQALLTFCKALIELSAYQDYICNFSVLANERLYKRFPGYLVRIGSGLHVGWAIEGAIGSNRKIDASYLSPHVNFTEFLESSTKSYGVPLLISEPFFKLLNPQVAKYVRNVDRVKKPGEDPIGLYAYDSDMNLNWADLRKAQKLKNAQKGTKDNEKDAAKKPSRRASTFHPSQTINTRANQAEEEPELSRDDDVEANATGTAVATDKKEIAPDIRVAKYKLTVWEKDPDLIKLRHVAYTNPEFRPMWDTGIAAYISGDWPTAEHIFKDTLKISGGKCGPSKFLLSEIKNNGGIAPSDWMGYREA